MKLRIMLFLLCLAGFISAQTTTVETMRIKGKMVLTGDTLSGVLKSISNAATHYQTPTAKAVYNYISAQNFLNAVAKTSRLSGSGTSGSPLDIAQQGASSGQVLKWNGSSWAPANDNTGGSSISADSLMRAVALYTASAGTLPMFTPNGNYGPFWAKNTTNGAFYRYDRAVSAWVADTYALTGDISKTSGSTTATIAANAVDSTKVKALSINNSDLAGNIQVSKLDRSGANTNEVLKWNGSAWAPATDNTSSGGGGGGWVIQTSAPSDTTKNWIATTNYDGTGIRLVSAYISGGWRKIGFYDPVQKRFSVNEPKYIVLAGQSNSTPRCGPTSNPADTVPSTYQCIWNPNTSSWTRPFNGSFAWMNGLSTRTAWHMTTLGQQAEKDGYLTRVVYAGLGGRQISYWLSPGGTQWDTISQRISASGIPRIDALVWYQGETDGWTFRTEKQYRSDWFTVMNQFRNLAQWNKNSKVFACQINTGLVLSAGETLWGGERPDGEMANYVFNQFASDNLDWTNVVRNDDATVVSDSSHIDAASHVTLGQRLWAAISGKSDGWLPNKDYNRLALFNKDTIVFNGSFSNIVLKKTTSTTTVIPKLAGWQDGKLLSLRIDAPSASKTVWPNGEAYCNNALGDVVEMDTSWGAYAAPGWFKNDTIIFGQCPAVFKSAQEFPLTLSPAVWLDAGKETKYTNNQQVDTLHDWSGNNRHFVAGAVNRGPKWKSIGINYRPSFKFSVAVSDTSTSKWAIRTSSDLSFIHKDSTTIFMVVKFADTLVADGVVCPLLGGTVGSSQLGYGLYYQRSPGNGLLVNLISNGSNLAVSSSNSLNGYCETGWGMIGTFTDPENSTASQRAKMFIGTNTYSSNTQTNATPTSNTSSFKIGRANSGNFSFKGEITELLIIPRGLKASEIAALKGYYALKFNLSL